MIPDDAHGKCAVCYEAIPKDSDKYTDALRHLVRDHPESELLTDLAAGIQIQTECSECGTEFVDSLSVAVSGGDAHLSVNSCCEVCRQEGQFLDLFSRRLTPAEVVSERIRNTNGQDKVARFRKRAKAIADKKGFDPEEMLVCSTCGHVVLRKKKSVNPGTNDGVFCTCEGQGPPYTEVVR